MFDLRKIQRKRPRNFVKVVDLKIVSPVLENYFLTMPIQYYLKTTKSGVMINCFLEIVERVIKQYMLNVGYEWNDDTTSRLNE